MSLKIALIELHQETNTFSNVPTTIREFEGFFLNYGEDLITLAAEHKCQIRGFYKAIKDHGKNEVEVIPVFSAWAYSGGLIEREVYDHFLEKIDNCLTTHPDLDGIYFSMHGSMGVSGIRDPESHLLEYIRAQKGKDFPIGVSFDLHANVTKRNVALATYIIGYKTNPHRDHEQVGYNCGRLLLQTIRKEIKPVMSFRKMRLIKGGGLGIDFLSPFRGVLKKMKKMERQAGVLSVSNFWIHIWFDDVELGWSTLVVTDDQKELGDKLAEELADINWELRDHKHPKPNHPIEAIKKADSMWFRRKFGALVFCDISDVVGAGAPGDGTGIIAPMMKHAPHLHAYVPIRDPESAIFAFNAPLNSEIELSVGGKLAPEYQKPVNVKGTIVVQRETDWGKTVILRHNGIHIILTEIAFPGFFPNDYKKVGAELWKADIIVVKNLFPFRFRFLKYNRGTFNVMSQGITNIDVHQLNYKSIPRPVYPLDPIEDWRPAAEIKT